MTHIETSLRAAFDRIKALESAKSIEVRLSQTTLDNLLRRKIQDG